MVAQNSSHLKKHSPSRILKSHLFTHYAKRLARESCKEQVMRWNLSSVNFCYISEWLFPEISFISVLRGRVPLGRKDALISQLVK